MKVEISCINLILIFSIFLIFEW